MAPPDPAGSDLTLRPFKIPAATYRLQMRREFPLEAASGVVSYLRLLGVSDLYLSPLHAAREGSIHGYDVVDHGRLNPELGSAKALRQLLDDVDAQGLGVVLDIVPNHMCIAGDGNPLWMDVLEDGRYSPSAARFDIDWDPPKPELVGKVLLPFLGDQYGRILEGELSVQFEATEGRFFVKGTAGRLPLGLETWHHVLEPALSRLRTAVAAEDASVIELESILRAISQTLPPLRQAGAERSVAHRHEKEAIRHRLAALANGNKAVSTALTEALITINGTAGDPASFDGLERLMDEQCYRLAYWRVAAHEVNYRRFFDINDLAAVRVENPAVFDDVHALPMEIARHPAFTGFRIDHVDGLSDPQQYLSDLTNGWKATGTAAGDPQLRPFVIVEKILGPDESLPQAWLADGTTGYDFIAILAGIFTRSAGSARLRAVAAGFGGLADSFTEISYDSKTLVLQTTLAAELTVLARRLDKVSEHHRYTRDFTLNHLQLALGEIISCFPVYRTYIRRDDSAVGERDSTVIATAVAAARRRNPLLNASLFDFIEDVLLRRDPPGLGPTQIDERRTFVTRFQQLTGPVVAKGIEDTAFYRYLPLVALNEVGGDPGRLGGTPLDPHRAIAARHHLSPHTLSASATHDTKRGEDTRARLYVLSEVADAWAAATALWSGLIAHHKAEVEGNPAPDSAEEYLLYQTLVGSWPLGGWNSEPDYPNRIRAYMAKARHEAKSHTSWINPHPGYDAAAEAFVDAALDPERSADFLSSVGTFAASITRPGLWNGLSQLVVKMAAPGIPDIFQGCELWDFSLVDPDNRRLIDFSSRRAWLNQISADVEAKGGKPIDALAAAPEDGRIKLWVTAAALRLRRARKALFQAGSYHPLAAHGAAADHVFAFARTYRDENVLAVTGRLFATLGADRPMGAAWDDTRISLPSDMRAREFRDVLTGQSITAEADTLPLASVCKHLPIALLEQIS